MVRSTLLLLTLLVSLISTAQAISAGVPLTPRLSTSDSPLPRKRGEGLETPLSLRLHRVFCGLGGKGMGDRGANAYTDTPFYAVLGPEAPAILHILIGDAQLLVIQPETLAIALKQHNVGVFILPQDWADDADLKAAQAAGIKLVYVQRHISVAAIEANIRLLAALTNTQSAGDRWIRTIDDGLARVQQNVQRYPISRILILTPEGYTRGQGTLITDLLRTMGGINVAAEAGIPEARQLEDAQIRQFVPDVVLLVRWTPEAALELALNPLYKGIPAFDRNRVYRVVLPGQSLTNLVEDTDKLANLIHPSTF